MKSVEYNTGVALYILVATDNEVNFIIRVHRIRKVFVMEKLIIINEKKNSRSQ